MWYGDGRTKTIPKLKDDKNLKPGAYDYNVSNDGINMVK